MSFSKAVFRSGPSYWRLQRRWSKWSTTRHNPKVLWSHFMRIYHVFIYSDEAIGLFHAFLCPVESVSFPFSFALSSSFSLLCLLGDLQENHMQFFSLFSPFFIFVCTYQEGNEAENWYNAFTVRWSDRQTRVPAPDWLRGGWRQAALPCRIHGRSKIPSSIPWFSTCLPGK